MYEKKEKMFYYKGLRKMLEKGGVYLTTFAIVFTISRLNKNNFLDRVNDVNNEFIYVIETGDTLESISLKFDVPVNELIERNNIKNINYIIEGNTIIIPNSYPKNNDLQAEISNNLPDGYVRGIDVSEVNGDVDWNKLEEEYNRGTFSFVILRMAENFRNGNREFSVDLNFEKNLSECNKRNIPYGVYVFSRGSTEEEINTETESIINYINNNLNTTKEVNGEELDLNLNLSLPFYMDCFEGDAASQYKLYSEGNYDFCAHLIKLWCDKLEEAGYFTGVYCNSNFYNNVGLERLSEYSLWIAHYGYITPVGHVSEMQLNEMVNFNSIVKNQQVTEKASISGINGYVDVNICDSDLLKIVKMFYSTRDYTRIRSN